MIRKYSAGQLVPSGMYWNKKTWELMQISEGGDYLPAGEGVAYYRVPLLLVLVVGPLGGLAFILFLPLAVPFVALHAAVKAIAGNIPWRRRKQEEDELRTAR